MATTRINTKETFTRPLLSKILFQVRFPNLFYLENKIGEFQLKIIEKFPESALLFRHQVVFTDLGSKVKEDFLKSAQQDGFKKKIWQFKSDIAEVNVTTDSIDIASGVIKLYTGTENCFRNLLQFFFTNFFEVMPIPQFSRIGLRYINEFTLQEKTNKYFTSMFNTVFPLERFKVEDSKEMAYKALNTNNNLNLIFQEMLQDTGDNTKKLVLDLDAFKINVPASSYLTVTDDLHTRIKQEFFNSIKEPVNAYMRGGEK